jgi:ribosomal protein L11 methyltransferase
MASAYVLKIGVPRTVRVGGHELSREDFYSWLWQEFGGPSGQAGGLQGVHEGTLLSEEAAELGLEADSWTLDAAEAPRGRDWMAGQARAEAELYFESLPHAQAASRRLGEIEGLDGTDRIHEQPDEDWDAKWKASFLANPEGVRVPPFWRILPPWTTSDEARLERGERILRINPGAGFGTGTHETTQLCLRAIGERALARGGSLQGERVLDFGSGSGILSIGAALAGGQVDGVEIDRLAIDNAVENAELNGVSGRVKFAQTLESAKGAYPLVIANILKPVLIEFAPELARRLAPQGTVILSGLIDKDVSEVAERYSAFLGCAPSRYELNEWRALIFRR